MKEQDMDEALGLVPPAKSPNLASVNPAQAGFDLSLGTGILNTDAAAQNAANSAQSDSIALEQGIFTSTPGVVGQGGGGASAGAPGAGGVGASGGVAFRGGIGGAITAPVVSKTPVAAPVAVNSASSLINHNTLNAYRQMRGLPLVQPPSSTRGIGAGSTGAL